MRNTTQQLISFTFSSHIDGSFLVRHSPVVSLLLTSNTGIESSFDSTLDLDVGVPQPISTHSGLDATADSNSWDATTVRAYVVLDLTSVVLYQDYTISLVLQNYTGEVAIHTSRHVHHTNRGYV